VDGLTDGDEVNVYATNPLDPDSDADGLTDGDEVNVFGTDPALDDTDDDRLFDGEEVNLTGTDPLLADTDGDGIEDGDELIGPTDPLDPDTDDDGLDDGQEINTTLTNPLLADTDGDGLTDGAEVLQYLTNPLNVDTDGGGVDDQSELVFGTDPLDGTDDATPQAAALFFDDFESGAINASWVSQAGGGGVLYDTAFVDRGAFAIRFAGGSLGETAAVDASLCTELGVTARFASGNPNTVEAGEPFIFSYFDGTGFVEFFRREAVGRTDYETEAIVISDPLAMNAAFALQFENLGTVGNFDHQHIDDLTVICDPDTADDDGDGFTNWLDCDDTSAAHFADCGRCVDLDGDDYGTDCDLGPDCDDSDATINPAAADPFGDGIDQDCTSADGPGLFDDFESGSASAATWLESNTLTITPGSANNGAFGLELSGAGGTAESQTIDMTACPSVTYSVTVRELGASLDPGDVVQVSYWDGAVWVTTDRVFEDTALSTVTFTGNIEGGPRADFALRLINNADVFTDQVAIDDVSVSCGGADVDGDGFDINFDCNDADANLWASCSTCVDADGDGYGLFCDLGPDCDDTDNAVNPGAIDALGDGIDQDCSSADGPGLFDDFESGGPSPAVFRQVDAFVSSSLTAFDGLASLEVQGRSQLVTAPVDTTTCTSVSLSARVEAIDTEAGDDLVIEYWDGTAWIEAARATFEDQPFTAFITPISDPLALSADFRVRIRNLGLASSIDGYLIDDFYAGCSGPDNDGDGFGAAVDCDDTDALLWSACGVCVDGDGDGYGLDCDLGEDCDDTDNFVFPGSTDPLGDGIDSDCTGADGVGFADGFEGGGAGVMWEVFSPLFTVTPNANAGLFGMTFTGTDVAESRPTDTSTCTAIDFAFFAQRDPTTPPETGDDLFFEWWDATTATWQPAASVLGGTTDVAYLSYVGSILSPNALGPDFRVRFATSMTSATLDATLVDDLTVSCVP
ncbi:MAG: MopE-related protein, partial [Myxococcota bacterium]